MLDETSTSNDVSVFAEVAAWVGLVGGFGGLVGLAVTLWRGHKAEIRAQRAEQLAEDRLKPNILMRFGHSRPEYQTKSPAIAVDWIMIRVVNNGHKPIVVQDILIDYGRREEHLVPSWRAEPDEGGKYLKERLEPGEFLVASSLVVGWPLADELVSVSACLTTEDVLPADDEAMDSIRSFLRSLRPDRDEERDRAVYRAAREMLRRSGGELDVEVRVRGARTDG